MKSIVFVAALIASTLSACKTGPEPTPDIGPTIIECTKDNVSNAAAATAVYNCLVGAIASDYSSCLSGILAVGQWTIAEVACLVREYAVASSVKINEGTAGAEDAICAANANAWIREKGLLYR